MNEPSDDEPDTDEPAKVGAQKGNRNGLRHGLTAGKLPKGCQYLENQLNGFRRTLEDIVLSVKGEISLPDAASIQTALKWERHGASTERDKALNSIGLDRDRIRDAWAIIDGDS